MSYVPADLLAHILRFADERGNRDGVIDIREAEFAAFIEPFFPAPPHEIMNAFFQADTNHDGKVTPQELADFVNRNYG